MKPQRIQLRRVKGFNLQATSLDLNGLPAKKVCRPSDFANPYKVFLFTTPDQNGTCLSLPLAHEMAVKMFKAYCPEDSLLAEAARRILRGHNLGCFCGLDLPCHADWLMEISNR